MIQTVFKPLYFRCVDGDILYADKPAVKAWRDREVAEITLAQWLNRFAKESDAKIEIVGFYLVREKLYTDIISPIEDTYPIEKLYFRCYNGKVMSKGIAFTDAFVERADERLKIVQRKTPYMWENETPPVESVEGFYLVNEQFYDEILKPFTREN
jgi:hypothetical protein